ncbi:hypothetical protein JZ751_014030, partial [Albula glossodonta]
TRQTRRCRAHRARRVQLSGSVVARRRQRESSGQLKRRLREPTRRGTRTRKLVFGWARHRLAGSPSFQPSDTLS